MFFHRTLTALKTAFYARRLAFSLLLDECDFSEERIKQFWVHLKNERRKELGEFHHLFNDLREDRERFKNYPRMDINTFDSILDMIRTDIEGPPRRPPFPLPTKPYPFLNFLYCI